MGFQEDHPPRHAHRTPADLAEDEALEALHHPRRQVAADAREYFAAGVFETVIPRNVRLAEAPSFGKPIILYDVASIGAQAYVKVAGELMARSHNQVNIGTTPAVVQQ